MFGEAIFIYSITQQLVGALESKYDKLLTEEKNEEIGVYRCKRMINNVQPIDVNGRKTTDFACLVIEFDTELEPVGIILDKQTVYITTEEIKALDTVEKWDDPAVAGILKHIQLTQKKRALYSQF